MPEPYKVLFTGSRTLLDPRPVHAGLEGVVAQLPPDREIIVMHGACRGADLIAHDWAHARRPRIRPREFPANWAQWPLDAGTIRNRQMVETGPDACLAVILKCGLMSCRRLRPHGSHGSTHCADLAESRGIPTFRHEPWRKA